MRVRAYDGKRDRIRRVVLVRGACAEVAGIRRNRVLRGMRATGASTVSVAHLRHKVIHADRGYSGSHGPLQ